MSWCTMWKGTPQDLMDHLRGAHNVPGEIKSASLEKYLPPLTPRHSGISTDVLLFSDIGLPTAGGGSPDSPCLGLLCPAGSPNAVGASPRPSRRAIRRRRPVRIMESPVQNVQILTVHDPLAAAGALVLDCHPRCCQCRWILVVWTCQRFGLRQCLPGLGSFLSNVSSCLGGGGGFA